MTISIDEFLRTGQLGSIALGISRDSVRTFLGDPETTSIQKHPEIWKYGPLEFAFYRIPDGSEPFLASISIYFRKENPWEAVLLGEMPVEVSGWSPTAETTFAEFRSYLDQSSIPIFGGVSSGPRQHLVLGSSVRATFDSGFLSSIALSSKREPDTKQVSISIPREHYETIAREAKSRGSSVAALCASWIIEHSASNRGAQV